MLDSSTAEVKVIIACATKEPANYFNRSTLLGRSLQNFPESLRPGIFLLSGNKGRNAMGLSEFYNRSIEQIQGDPIVVFCHDDVYIHDWHIAHSLFEGLKVFDVIGPVGASHVPYGQPGWWFTLDFNNKPLRNDRVQRSGCLNHFDPVLVKPDYYGPSPRECDLIDGVFMATHMSTLRSLNLRFDPRFKFHCYDSDFCYSARALGLRIGSWPISLTHGSGGEFGREWCVAASELTKKLTENPK